MNKKDLFDAIGEIDDELIEKTEEKASKKNNIVKIIVPIAACLCIGVGAIAFVRSSFLAPCGMAADGAAAYDTAEVVVEEETQTEIAMEETVHKLLNEENAVAGAEESEEAISEEPYNEAADKAVVTGTSKASRTTKSREETTVGYTSTTKASSKQETTKAVAETKKEVATETEVSTTTANTEPENWHMFNGVITEVNGNSIVVEKYDHKKGVAYSSTDPIYPTGEVYQMKWTGKTYKVGDKVTVYYTGEVMETFPAQIEAYKINIANFPTED